jgi:hypothetical protein
MIDQKYEISKDQYTYTVNPYGHSSQSHTTVGNWKGFSEDYTKMLFDKVYELSDYLIPSYDFRFESSLTFLGTRLLGRTRQIS